MTDSNSGFLATKPPPPPSVFKADESTITSDNFYEYYYRHLIGCKITAVGMNAEGFPYFVIIDNDGNRQTIEISQDEEGNGPGFLFGLPNPYDYYQQR
jgi:hypothetical protein